LEKNQIPADFTEPRKQFKPWKVKSHGGSFVKKEG
jgi:hypothetical protein